MEKLKLILMKVVDINPPSKQRLIDAQNLTKEEATETTEIINEEPKKQKVEDKDINKKVLELSKQNLSLITLGTGC